MNSVRVRVRLTELGRSQEWLARALGIHPTLLSRYLRGLRRPPADLEHRIAECLDRHLLADRAAEEARQKALAS